MRLYHFTSSNVLRPIGEHGLTIGDVATDVRHRKGKNGVWLTTNPEPMEHGLRGSLFDKTQCRLTIDIQNNHPKLKRWLTWADKHVHPFTAAHLRNTVDRNAPNTWFIFFGCLSPESVLAAHDMRTGTEIVEWQDHFPRELDVPAVPYWKSKAWHKDLMKQFKVLERMQKAA